MYYDYQRWYDPSIGRFISQDPLAGHLSDPQSLNPYVYVENTPTSMTDPSGQDPFGMLVGAVLGAGIGYGWCVAETGGWTSSTCGEYALMGAFSGALAGATDGVSLLADAACEGDNCVPPPDPTSPSTTDPATTCLCPDVGGGDTSGTPGETITPKITSTTADETPKIISVQGSGDQFSRIWEFEDTTVRVNTGHGFDAAKHLLLDSGLSKDDVESAIVKDVVQQDQAGLVPKTPPPGIFKVSIGDVDIEYRALYVGNPDYDIAVGTYYRIRLPLLD